MKLNLLHILLTVFMVLAGSDLLYSIHDMDTDATEIIHLDGEVEIDVEVETLFTETIDGNDVDFVSTNFNLNHPPHNSYYRISTPPPEFV